MEEKREFKGKVSYCVGRVRRNGLEETIFQVRDVDVDRTFSLPGRHRINSGEYVRVFWTGLSETDAKVESYTIYQNDTFNGGLQEAYEWQAEVPF